FTAAQLVTAVLAAARWPAGPKFSAVYVLGFACFALTAAWAADPAHRRDLSRIWIAVGGVLGLVGAVLAFVANVLQRNLWGTGIAVIVGDRKAYAAKVTIAEWNVYSSFLLV